ncbi:TetR/AcrR family transcriptional regulator [Clostridium sp.]
MTTKERILDETLTLFSKNSYDGVSVKDIPNAVGVKDSSLYKH